MQATVAEPVTTISSADTTNGLPDSEPRVVDVTAELIGERREEWRSGFDAGLRDGARRVMHSDAMGQLAFDLKVLRICSDAMADVAVQRERLLAHWKSEAQWWREEHDRVRDEYHAFTREMVRRFAK